MQIATNQQLSGDINSLSRSYQLIHSTPPRTKLLLRKPSMQRQVNACFKCSSETARISFLLILLSPEVWQKATCVRHTELHCITLNSVYSQKDLLQNITLKTMRPDRAVSA